LEVIDGPEVKGGADGISGRGEKDPVECMEAAAEDL
jgi:hypothetical protein